jgi:thiosulfate/3-mercaptopyruvate sulfurtransferase
MSAFVTTDWLLAHLNDADLRVVEASIDKANYDSAHVPGAVWCDHFADLLLQGDDSQGFVITPEQYAGLMSRWGITPKTTVVWYGDRHSSYASRGLWTMAYYEHPAPVYVLEGGRERWLAEGRPTTAGAVATTGSTYPVPVTHDEGDHADWQRVRDAVASSDTVILDVRSADEHTGKIARARRGGHIPGAVHVEWTEAAAGDNRLKSVDELRAMYAAAGVTPDKEIIAHCQLGVRASHTWFVLKHVLGYPNVRNYDGSWAEWGNRDDSPIES